MFKNLLSLATEFMGGSSVQIYIYIGLLLGGFGAGFYVEHLRFSNYQIQVEQAAKAQEAQNESIKKQQEIANRSITNEYETKLSAVRAYYGGLHNSSSGKLPTLSNPASGTDESPAYYRLAESCAETTAQLTSLQEWIATQVGITNGK
jgi:hypothetical protein